MLLKTYLLIVILAVGNLSDENGLYYKEFYETGGMKAEGWVKDGVKQCYWRFYHKNGGISEKGHYKNGNREAYWYFYNDLGKPTKEGHYLKGKMADWWLFFDANGKVNHKCQLNEGVRNGYCLQYVNEKLSAAEKYRNGRQVKKWTSFSSFKRENKLSDLE